MCIELEDIIPFLVPHIQKKKTFVHRFGAGVDARYPVKHAIMTKLWNISKGVAENRHKNVQIVTERVEIIKATRYRVHTGWGICREAHEITKSMKLLT